MRPANRETTISMPTVSGYLLLLLTLGFESFLTQVAFAQTNIYYGDQNSHLIVETNVATPTASRSILASGSSSVDTPTGMALDRSQGILYWGNQGSTSIRQVNISSAGSVSDFISNQANVFGVVFDPVNDKVYWSTGSTTRMIRRADPNGTNVETIFDSGSAQGPTGLILDLVDNRIFWTDTRDDGVHVGTISGSSLSDTTLFTVASSNPVGIDISLAQGRVFWAGPASGEIYGANIDGSGQVDILVSGLSSPNDLSIDRDQSKIYWTESVGTRIQRANFDGSNVEEVLISPNVNSPAGIYVDSPLPTPTPEVVTPDTVPDPPEVTVTGRKAVITLEEFSDVSLASSEALDSRLRANVRRLTFRYDTRVRKENKSRDTARRQTKQNRATFGRLDDASYTVRYRALIARRRARRQIQALKVRGKKGFNAKFKVIAKTSFSTARQFTIGD